MLLIDVVPKNMGIAKRRVQVYSKVRLLTREADRGTTAKRRSRIGAEVFLGCHAQESWLGSSECLVDGGCMAEQS